MNPDQDRDRAPRPRLTRSDGLLLAALLISAPPGHAADLKDLLASADAAGIRELPAAVHGAIGAPPYPDPEVEDCSVGRLPGLQPEDLAVAYTDFPDVARAWIESQPAKRVR